MRISKPEDAAIDNRFFADMARFANTEEPNLISNKEISVLALEVKARQENPYRIFVLLNNRRMQLNRS
jgi:hypothetical protein